MTLTRRQVQEMITARDLRPSRALGQNFVADPNTVRRIARLAELVPGQRVVEIGAGLGALTLALAEAGARVTAVEIDRHLVPVLRDQVEERGVRVVEDDALTLDWAALLDDDGDTGADSGGHDAPWVLVANLPYNVAVPVIVRVLEEAPAVASMLVMVQREVGERLAAVPGTKSYGAVSVKVAYYATARLVGRVPAAVFVPRPRVESVLVRIVRREAVAVDPSRGRPRASCSPWCGPASPNGARCCAGRWPVSSIPSVFAAAAVNPASPGRRTVDRGLGETGGVRGRPRSMTSSTTVTAPAKLTLSLRVTGRRADGYHLLDAEMVTVSLSDSLVFSPGDDLCVVDEVVGGTGHGHDLDRARQPGGPGPGPGGPAGRGPAGEAHPGRRRTGRRLGRRRRRPALGPLARSGPGCAPSGPTCPSASGEDGPG